MLALEIAIRIPAAHSLKDRRRVVRSLVEAPRRRFAVAAADVDDAEDPKRAVLGYCAVSNNATVLEEQLGSVEDLVWSHPELEVLDTRWTWLDH